MGRPGEIYFITDAEPVEFREFITSLLKTQGLEAPDKQVPHWLVQGIATVTGWIARFTGNRWTPPVTRQALPTSAVEVTLDTRKARAELGYKPPVARERGLATMRSEKQASSAW